MRFTLLCVLSFLPVFLHAQSLIFKQLDVENGLPGQETYETLQASNGFLWIATDRGVCRFNGRDFQCFSVEDGLLDNAVLGLYEDGKGNIWFPLALGGLNYWDGQTIKQYRYNDTLLRYIANSGSIDRLVIDENESLWAVGFKEGVLLEIDKNGNATSHINAGPRGHFYVKKFANGDLLSGPYCGLSNCSSISKTSLLVFHRPHAIDSIHLPFQIRRSARTEILEASDASFIMAIDTILFQFKEGEILARHDFSHAIVGIEERRGEGVWVTTEEGLFHFEGNINSPGNLYLEEHSPCFVEEDFEGGIWVNSLTSGLFYLPPLRWMELPLNNTPVSHVEIFDKDIVFSDFKGSVSVIKETETGMQIDTILKNGGYSPTLFAMGDSLYAGVNLILKKEGGYSAEKSALQRVLSFSRGEGAKVYVGTITGYVEMENGIPKYSSSKQSFNKRVSAISEIGGGKLLIGTSKGLYLRVGQEISKIKDLAVVDILAGPQESHWVLTDGQGTYLYRKGRLRLMGQLNLSSNLSTCGLVDSEENIWIGTTRGLNRVELVTAEPLKTRTTQFNISDGLPSYQINSLVQMDSALVIGTNKGIVKIKLKSLVPNKRPPVLQLTGIRLNDTISLDSSYLELAPDENELSFEFEGISFRDANELSYRYKLDGQDDKWQSTTQNKVKYTNLRAGTYSFLVSVRNADGEWSELIKSQSITIKQSLFAYFWFWFWVWVLFAALVLVISVKVISYVKRNEANKRELLIAEQMALKAQMKPHFIFNALNAIQLFIARNQKKEANIYLSNFSQLMRNILDGSSKRLIPLSEEIAMLENYLSLEMLRLKGRLRYDIEIERGLCVERILIPPMLIQPILENALWHGLSSKDSMGILALRIRLDNSNLKIEVEDNGIGRAAASQRKNMNRSKGDSIGLQNIVDRLRIAFPDSVDQPISIIDLYEGTEPVGTKVILEIPVDLSG
ncbi:histidine kinase [Croceimicrobium sp.]|uniref:sensor histidine kinase n=1 Tax=Croceimicrobium sp. TaxID=2828340 RepID=UPI003BA86BB9